MPGLYTAGVAILLIRDDKVLIAKRSENKDFGAGLWELPSGRIEQYESIEEAIRREGKEELGTEIIPVDLLDAYIFQRNEQELLLLTYRCKMNGEISLSDEHDTYKWVSHVEARKLMAYDLQKRVLDKI